MPEITPTRSVLRRRGRAFPALPPTTMTSAETLPRQRRHPFRREAGRPQVRAALLHHTVAASTPLRLDHKSFAVLCPLALLGSAFYAVLVHRLVIYAPRFLSTVDYSSAVALHFAHCGQLATGLSPAGVRPCWAHKDNARPQPRVRYHGASYPKSFKRSRRPVFSSWACLILAACGWHRPAGSSRR